MDQSDEWDFSKLAPTLEINLAGLMLCMKYEIRSMCAAGRGSIVNISSVAGLVGTPGRPAYVASKHGVIGLTRTAALEFGPETIRVNAICPGATKTPLLESAILRNPPLEEHIAIGCPLRRIAVPEEIAQAVFWVASDNASYGTGQAMAVDGGYTAG